MNRQKKEILHSSYLCTSEQINSGFFFPSNKQLKSTHKDVSDSLLQIENRKSDINKIKIFIYLK